MKGSFSLEKGSFSLDYIFRVITSGIYKYEKENLGYYDGYNVKLIMNPLYNDSEVKFMKDNDGCQKLLFASKNAEKFLFVSKNTYDMLMSLEGVIYDDYFNNNNSFEAGCVRLIKFIEVSSDKYLQFNMFVSSRLKKQCCVCPSLSNECSKIFLETFDCNCLPYCSVHEKTRYYCFFCNATKKKDIQKKRLRDDDEK